MSCDEGAQHAMPFLFNPFPYIRSLTFAGIEAHIDTSTWQWLIQAVGCQSDRVLSGLRVESSIEHVDRKAYPALRCVRLKPI